MIYYNFNGEGQGLGTTVDFSGSLKLSNLSNTSNLAISGYMDKKSHAYGRKSSRIEGLSMYDNDCLKMTFYAFTKEGLLLFNVVKPSENVFSGEFLSGNYQGSWMLVPGFPSVEKLHSLMQQDFLGFAANLELRLKPEKNPLQNLPVEESSQGILLSSKPSV